MHAHRVLILSMFLAASARAEPPSGVFDTTHSAWTKILQHRVHILEMNGESYRFKDSVRRLGKKTPRQHPTDTPTQKPNKKEEEDKP